MKRQRAKITLEFSVDLDMVPGYLNKIEDWEDLAVKALSLNSSYNPEVKIISSEVSGSDWQTKIIAEYLERKRFEEEDATKTSPEVTCLNCGYAEGT